jgi:hypothetical protein
MSHRRLSLHEEILLLALRDKEGTVAGGTYYSYALGGALLAELLLQRRIKIDESGRKKLVVVASSKPVGDPLLDECLEKVKTAKRRGSVQTWVGRFAGLKRLKHRVALGLCERGILKADEDTVLRIFKRKTYPEVDPEPERVLIKRLRQAIFTYTRELDPRTVVLVALAHSAGILKVVFDKKKLKGRKKRLEQIARGDVVGEATREVIQAMQAAVVVAAVVPAVVATSSAH